MHPAGMDASPLRMPGGKNLSHVHSQATLGAASASSSGTDDARDGAADGSCSAEERGALPAPRLSEETEEPGLSDQEEWVIPEAAVDMRCRDNQAC